MFGAHPTCEPSQVRNSIQCVVVHTLTRASTSF